MPEYTHSTVEAVRTCTSLRIYREQPHARMAPAREASGEGATTGRIESRIRGCLTLLLLAAWLAMNACLWSACRRGDVYPQPIAAAGLGVLFAEVALICACLPRCAGPFASRTLVALGLLCGLAHLASGLAGKSEQPARWGALLLLYGGMTMAVLCLPDLRLAGRRMLPGKAADAARSRQYTLRGLFDVTTTLGLGLGAVHWTAAPGASGQQLGAFCGLATLLSVSAVVGSAGQARRHAASLLLLLLASPLLAVCLERTGIPPRGTSPLILLAAAQAVALSGSLAAIRVAGHPPVLSRE